jgi:hypothetical protein
MRGLIDSVRWGLAAFRTLFWLFTALWAPTAWCTPLPEPGLILYGVVSNAAGGQRLAIGNLEWTIESPSGGQAVKVRATLTNLNDQFSYVLEIPFETRLVGGQSLGATPGALELSATPTSFNRATVMLDGIPATVLDPGQRTFRFGPSDRGRMERVDLVVSTISVDTDSDGLTDAWERTFFGNLGRDGKEDFDRDGVTDADEHVAGTSPTDPQSVFKFIEIQPAVAGGVRVRWSSIAGRTYTLERSNDLRSGFAPIQTGIAATPPENGFTDAAASSIGPNFYRLTVNR